MDPLYVSFTAPILTNEVYIIASGPMPFTEHADFAIATKNPDFDATLCGEVTVTPKYEGVALTGAEILTYDPLNNRFTITSDDEALIGDSKKYSLAIEFVDYASNPTADTEEVEADITFTDPCLLPTAFDVVL